MDGRIEHPGSRIEYQAVGSARHVTFPTANKAIIASLTCPADPVAVAVGLSKWLNSTRVMRCFAWHGHCSSYGNGEKNRRTKEALMRINRSFTWIGIIALAIASLAITSPAEAQRRSAMQVGPKCVGGIGALFDEIEPVALARYRRSGSHLHVGRGEARSRRLPRPRRQLAAADLRQHRPKPNRDTWTWCGS